MANVGAGLCGSWLVWELACVGAGLPAMQTTRYIRKTQLMPSQASQLPQGTAHASLIRSAVRPPRFAFAFDLGRPVKHAGRNSTWIWGVNRQGCRFSRPAPWMARGGGPPNPCRITGMPSLGEAPSVGARAFCLLLRSSKVSRRKGGTISRRYRSNGYVLTPTKSQTSGTLPTNNRLNPVRSPFLPQGDPPHGQSHRPSHPRFH